MKASAYASVIATTFVGGATGYLTVAFANGIPAGFEWKAIVISAILAGVSALAHLWQTPTDVPPPVKLPARPDTTIIPPDSN